MPVRAPTVDQRQKTHFAHILFATTLVVPHNCTGRPAGHGRVRSRSSPGSLQPRRMARVPGNLDGCRQPRQHSFGRRPASVHFEIRRLTDAARDLHDPLLDFERRRSSSTTAATGLIGRAVWTDDRGDQVFSELTGERHLNRQQDRWDIRRRHGALLRRYRAATNSRGASCWRLKTETYKGNRGSEWDDPRGLGASPPDAGGPR